ncbi:MAG TPA: nuclear transport factor 2 family protein [Steroidobacteraceae bacterium]|nr:nuclear transport factor 2 family protein [Steroidobacteraceae bacterium]
MTRHKGRAAAWFAAGAIAALGVVIAPRFVRADGSDSAAERLQRVEDRQEIEELFTAYGATLDRRDFDAFGRLFAEEAVYAGGPGTPVHGRAAIQALLQQQITSNPSHLPAPDFHLYFNPSIQVDGNRAVASSKGAYIIPDLANNGARIVFFVTYDDTLIRREGRWVFMSRTIHGGIPAPKSK